MTEIVSQSAFREALSRFASGVVVVTAQAPDGPVGFTASAFSSVSLDPPLILVCVGKSASAHGAVLGAPRFGISVLREKQAWIAEQFARKGSDRFAGVPLAGSADVPWIAGALAHLECEQKAIHDAGDHSILVGEVLEAQAFAGTPLVHFARRFGGFDHDFAPVRGRREAIASREES